MIQLPDEYDPVKILKECNQIEADIKNGARKPLTENELAGKTGELATTNEKYHVCIDCKTSYPVDDEFQKPRCNGYSINLCPWCRPDSQPWKNGRGI